MTPAEPAPSRAVQVSLSEIRLDGGTQPRELIDFEAVYEYAKAMAEGQAFPPITVYYDGVDHWIADGFHRYHAAKQVDHRTILADVHPGTRRDAVLHAVGANRTHGLRRTLADKRRAVLTLLRDEEWGGWADREIGRRCGVDHKTVAIVRESLTGDFPSDAPTLRTYTTKHGTTATMETAKIGRRADQAPPDPGAVVQLQPVIRPDEPEAAQQAQDERDAVRELVRWRNRWKHCEGLAHVFAEADELYQIHLVDKGIG